MTFQIEGAVAVVTGGAGGIGHAVAHRLATDGAAVAIVDLDGTRAQEAAAQLPTGKGQKHIGLAADVGRGEEVNRIVAAVESELGPIAVYFSNAGIATGPGLGEDGDWEASWKVHVMAHVNAARAVLPGMAERKNGAFIVTASAAGLLMMMQSAAYTVTKHASVAITEWLAVNYGGDESNIQFHCLAPQGVLTPMVTGGTDKATTELQAAGNLLAPEAVADAVRAAIEADTFLILPHPEVHGYEQAKVADRDKWLRGMRRLLNRVRTA